MEGSGGRGGETECVYILKIELAGCTVDRIAMRYGKKGKISGLVSGKMRIDSTPTQECSLPAGGPQVRGYCHQTNSLGRWFRCQAGIRAAHRSARSQAAKVVREFQTENPREGMILRDPGKAGQESTWSPWTPKASVASSSARM